jgi:hypothetical protein
MADLNETTLAAALGATGNLVVLTSAASVSKGDNLFIDGETVRAVSDPIGACVRVMRGIAGVSVAHAAGMPVFSGRPHLFYTVDPSGSAPGSPDANPWINLAAGRVWRARGDAVGGGLPHRVWELVTVSYPIGAMGVRGAPVYTPSSS